MGSKAIASPARGVRTVCLRRKIIPEIIDAPVTKNTGARLAGKVLA
jgi:hypothetical protein